MFNLSNLLCGYNENRVWNLIPFAGAGVGRSMSANRYAMGLSAGLQSSWKVSKGMRVYLEAGGTVMKAISMVLHTQTMSVVDGSHTIIILLCGNWFELQYW